MITNKKKNGGFTLIELLVVISIIGLISSMVLTSLNMARLKARNSKRQADLKQIQVAIELFFNDVGRYPTCVSNNPLCSTAPAGSVGFMSTMEITPTYIRTISDDPSNANGQYGYYYARGYRKTTATSFINTGLDSDYILATRLENGPCSFAGWNNNCLNLLLGS